MTADEQLAGAFYGRRKGKKLRAAQDERLSRLLPNLRLSGDLGPIDPSHAFDFDPSAVVLEIGFGGGEHLAAEAQANPQAGFIGCEPFVNGMAKLLALTEERDLLNIRLWDRDARELMERLPPASVDILYLLYPDPWPKRRQHKRRFVSAERLNVIARILKPGGEFRFASDIDDYAGWTLARAIEHPCLEWVASTAADWRRPWPGWQSTRYESKALCQGRRPTYLTFRRLSAGRRASADQGRFPPTRLHGGG